MSDALPLPPRPNIEQYKTLAKECQRAWRSPDPGVFREWATHWVQTLARLQGRAESECEVRQDIGAIERQWQRMQKSKEGAAPRILADAQLFVARCHGFASWPKFIRHLEGLARVNSPASTFELAADAIVNGDLATLELLLTENPALIRARSGRDHRSTLLHYVSANGVEDFRQKTPRNIVDITKLLLDAGADINAESDAYGGRSTTLGLTATSWHPQKAGVQLPLMELLIDHGAIIDGSDGGSAVNGCLHNGRGEAARFLASRGARLDLEGAAGVGRLDIVKSFFRDDGNLKPPTEYQMKDAFAWACEFGQPDVVEFLLQNGIDVATGLRHHGQTGLHWAAFGGHVDTLKLLLERGASVSAKDPTFDGTPLEWALYAWGTGEGAPPADHYEVVATLARAGAHIEPKWFADDEDRKRAAGKVQSDPRMAAALRGKSSSG